MPKSSNNLDWQKLDTSDLKGADKKAFDAYQDSYETMLLSRETMQDQFSKTLDKQFARGEHTLSTYHCRTITSASAPSPPSQASGPV